MRIIVVTAVIITLVAGTGWVKNIIKLSNCDFEEQYKAEVVYMIGIIPPVGMVTGWLDVGK